MAWNRPSEQRPVNLSPRKGGIRQYAWIGILAALTGCVGWGIYWASGGGWGGSESDAKTSGLIKDVGKAGRPSATDTDNQGKSGNGQHTPGHSLPPPVVPPVTAKVWQASCEGVGWHNGVYHSPDPQFEAKKKVLDELDARQNPFRHSSETMISAVVNSRPGGFLFPEDYGPAFVADFLDSLKDPIIISQNDPEDVKEKKRAVREAKIYLKERLDAGEEIGKIMKDAHDEVNRLTQLHDDYAEQLTELRMKGGSREEIEDLVTAANMILEKKGALPLNMPIDTSKFKFKTKGKKQ